MLGFDEELESESEVRLDKGGYELMIVNLRGRTCL
jgi:hypothetical protein